MDKEELEKLLTCPICLDRFKQPKQLPCQHTFCLRPCLARLVQNHRICCPECRGVHGLPHNGVNGFPNNLLAVKLLDLPVRKDSSIEAPCQDCKYNNVEAGCHHCDKILCRDCLRNHSQMLSKELRKTDFSVRKAASKLSKRIADIDQHDQKIKKNAEEVKTEIKLWRQHCITEIENRTRKFLDEADAFVVGEVSPFKPEKDELAAVAEVINNFCSSSGNEIMQLERNDTSASSLSKHQKEAKQLIQLGNQHTEGEKNFNIGKQCKVTNVLKFEKRQSQSIIESISSFSGVQLQAPVVLVPVKQKPRTPLRLHPVINRGGQAVMRATTSRGQVKRVFGKQGSNPGCLNEPWGIASGPNGSIVVADTGNHRIQVFDPVGRSIRCFGSQGSGPGQFLCPCGVGVSSLGLIAVADHNNHRIQIFSWEGRYVREFGKDGPGKFSHPWSVKFGNDGLVYVTACVSSVRVFSLNGDFMHAFGDGFFPYEDVDGKVYVTMKPDGKVVVLYTYVRFLGLFCESGDLLWRKVVSFEHARAVDCDKDGNIIVGDNENDKIKVFDKNGVPIWSFGSKGSNPGQFEAPRGIAVLQNGDIAISDANNHRIQIFSSGCFFNE